jgi:16S rRNA (cytosine1402-N4)-methyltransferase
MLMEHKPVLYREVISALQPDPQGRYVDGTVGAGGHAYGILEASAPGGKLLGLDRDPQALEIAAARLALFEGRVDLVHGSYQQITLHLNNQKWGQVDGVLLDLGLSSLQLEQADRGFSFQKEGPLDMRFDPAIEKTAADIVNTYPRKELANLLYEFGEEKNSRKIADAIIASRPLWTTRDLVSAIDRAGSKTRSRTHPATRTFQALRIAVNDELAALEAFLPEALEAIKPGGRLAVIAYHSLEDRIVKHFFRRESADCICPPEIPICVCDHRAALKEISHRPIRPGDAEVAENPRSRSAKLRVAEKL